MAIDTAQLPRLDWRVPERFRRSTVLNRAAGFREKVVALTFDDGPDPKVTPRILDALRARGAKATFFVLGPAARRYPALLRRMVREGHCIGNHSWSHDDVAGRDQAALEVLATNRIVARATGSEPTLFRTPYGIRTGQYASQAKRLGLSNVLWSRTLGDDRAYSQDQMLASVGLPRAGEIILCHDGPGKAETAKVVPAMLDRLAKAGYRLATVPELLERWDAFLSVREAESKRKPNRGSRRPTGLHQGADALRTTL